MKANAKSLALVVLGLFVGGLSYVGCDDISKDIASVNPETKNFLGTVLGRVLDRCSGAPIAGVKVGLAGKSEVTTNSNGEFVFRDVPVNAEYTYNNGYTTYWDNYEVHFDFTSYNKNKPDSLKYADYVVEEVDVYWTDLNDGDNTDYGDGGDNSESGSGADTPVDGIVSSMTNLEFGMLNTTIMGQVVDGVTFAPAANATVLLKHTNGIGHTYVVKTTTTDANGNYTFTNVENGRSLTIEGWDASKIFFGSVGVNLTCGQDPMLLTQVDAERLALTTRDNFQPRVVGLSVANNADVTIGSNGIDIVFTFSEPIKQTAYTNTTLPKGHSTIIDGITATFVSLKKGMGPILFGASWNATFDQLTVNIPAANLVESGRYTLTYSGVTGNLTDNAGNGLVNNTTITGDFFETLNFTTAGSATPPTAPVLQRDSNHTALTAVNWNGGSVRLRWIQTQNTVKYFDIYKKIGAGPFDRLATNVRTTDTTLTIGTEDLNSGGNDPRYAQSVQFYVQAISINLTPSAASNILTVVDKNLPNVTSADSLTVDANNNPIIRVLFDEPIPQDLAETTTNYSFSNDPGNTTGTSVLQAVYRGYNGTTWQVDLTVTPNSLIYSTDQITVSANIRDLSDNILDTANSANVLVVAP